MSSKPTSKPSTGSSTSGGTNVNKYDYEKKEFILKGAVILCQHGFLGTEDTMNPLFKNLKDNVLKGFYQCEFCDGIIRYSELSPSNSAITELNERIKQNPEHNFFIRTLFSNPQYGAISTQANELKEIINTIRKKNPNVPIVLVGYSKGGVVNCKCAIENPGLIDTIINVGTPHEDTLIQDLIQIIGDSYKDKCKFLGCIPNPVADLAIQGLVELVNLGVDNVLNETVTYKDLKKEWNALTKKSKFIVIAAEAIEVDGQFNGDFVVPTESAIASGFRGRTYNNTIDNFIVRDDKVTIDLNVLKPNLLTDFALDLLSGAVEAITGFDVVKTIEVIFDIISNFINNEGNFTKCFKLAHCSLPIINNKDFMLTHNTIGMRVLAGLNT